MYPKLSKTEAIKTADAVIFQNTGMHMTDIQVKVLAGSLEGLTYQAMADEYGYSSRYLNQDVGNKLWRKLTIALGEQVKKKQLKEPLERWRERNEITIEGMPVLSQMEIGKTVQYIERPPAETRCYKAIIKPGALLRIKAPQKMGKTWLMNQVLNQASLQNYQTVTIDLILADTKILSSLEEFYKWLCVNIADYLGYDNKLNEYWRDLYGLNQNCTRYLHKYILTKLEHPLVLALDNLDAIFKYEEIFQNFSQLLRSWFEKSKSNDTSGQLWKLLRLMVVNSTQIYPNLDINHSPFNVGVAIDLPDFTLAQVETLALSYSLEMKAQISDEGFVPLFRMVGGHPYLVQLALAHLKDFQVTLTELLAQIPTEEGIYSNYLRGLLSSLDKQPLLKDAFKKVLENESGTCLETKLAFQLHSMGLVKLTRNDCITACQLYQDYFKQRL